ncbi:hypothetical protein FA13DRAFT_1255263 [Coprinellus micaceus]|uniref:Uncharacterized protein n=1 Tax=Coprinellus micaceus TaxID=71717 RepID=A0A4Y7TR11_COPMI|nr:hypothetical protein FA13DRAFT_1255263 [Coprinellus micaceus]
MSHLTPCLLHFLPLSTPSPPSHHGHHTHSSTLSPAAGVEDLCFRHLLRRAFRLNFPFQHSIAGAYFGQNRSWIQAHASFAIHFRPTSPVATCLPTVSSRERFEWPSVTST